MKRRRGLALAALVLVAALALGAWLTRPRASATREPASAAAAAQVAAAAPDLAMAAWGASLPPLEELPEPVRRLLEATPYPPSSGRLHPGQADLLEPNRRYERHRPIPDTLSHDPAEVVTWLFSADRYAYTGAEVVHAFLEVRRGSEPVAVEISSASAVREGRAGAEGPRERLDFRREGRDLVADLPLHLFSDHFGSILLEVRFEYAPGRFHEDALRVFHTPESRIPARITGAVRDLVRDGSLLLELGVEIERPGFYRFDANVYGPDGAPVAWVAWKGELEPGAQAIPLELYGKVLRDAGVPGPYTLEQVRGYRFLDGQFPDRENLHDLAGTHTTRGYPLGAFTDVRHDSAEELALASMLLDDLANGIGVMPPPLADGSTPAGALEAAAPRPPDDDAEVEPGGAPTR